MESCNNNGRRGNIKIEDMGKFKFDFKEGLTEEEFEDLRKDKVPECSEGGCEIVAQFLEKDEEELKHDELEQLASVGIIDDFLDRIQPDNIEDVITKIKLSEIIISELTQLHKDILKELEYIKYQNSVEDETNGDN